MSFDPRIKIGQVLKNSEVTSIFKCGNMGGMRRSISTNTLVIVSDYTKGLYHDKWIGGVLHYTGMGKCGDQDIDHAQNATLANCAHNGVDVHLFEVIDAGDYIYCGKIELVSDPYTEVQLGEDKIPRKVWMFPVRPVPDNNVKKPPMFVFKDMNDYKARGKTVDADYAETLIAKGKVRVISKPTTSRPISSSNAQAISTPIVGQKIKHTSFGCGTVKSLKDDVITIKFDNGDIKQLKYSLCLQYEFLELV